MLTYYDITDKTSTLILLNSSKQDQAPTTAIPDKYRPIVEISTLSEQLNTKHLIYKALDKSFTVSVLPVPAGPEGQPPKYIFKALVKVKKHLSCRGVITSLELLPKYSYDKDKTECVYII